MIIRDTRDAAQANVRIELRVLVADGDWCDPTEIRLIRDTYAGDADGLNLEADIAENLSSMIADASAALEPHAARIMWGAGA